MHESSTMVVLYDMITIMLSSCMRILEPQLQEVIEGSTEFITLKIQPTLSLTQGLTPTSLDGKTRVVPTKVTP